MNDRNIRISIVRKICGIIAIFSLIIVCTLPNSHTVYAKDTKYTVVFNKNASNATGTMTDQKITYNSKVALKSCAFKRSGYQFQGWAKTAKGKVVYKNKAQVKNLTTAGKKVILYAVWKADSKRRALILGETSSSAVPMLDVASMKSMMENCTFNGKKMVSIESYPNHTLDAIELKIKQCFENTKDDDVSYIYFTCHGQRSDTEGKMRILIGTDGGWTATELHDILNKYTKGNVILMIDCCYAENVITQWGTHSMMSYSGQTDFSKEFISQFRNTGSREKGSNDDRFQILCASREYETSLGPYVTLGCSLATKYWEKGCGWNADNVGPYSNGEVMGDMPADLDRNKKITMQELYRYSYPLICEDADRNYAHSQHIQVYPANSSTVLFARD